MTTAPHREGPAAPSRPVTVHGRALALLGTAAPALAAAFVLLPRTLAARGTDGGLGEKDTLAAALREAFVAYWRSGERGFPPDLDRIVAYWFRYHVAKAVIAALLLAVLVALGVLLWKAFLKVPLGAGKSFAFATAGVLATALALLSLAALMANVQGAAAPFASLLPMLPTGVTGVTGVTGATGATEGELADVLDRIRQSLAAGDHASPALDVMTGDFARYHAAMVVISVAVAVGLITLSALSWKRFRRTAPAERRTRRAVGVSGVLSVLSSLLVLVVAMANTTTAADPRPALLAFFEGGW